MIRNYRVCFRAKAPVPTHEIHEVFYDNHYEVIGYEKTPAIAFGRALPQMITTKFCSF